MDAYTPTMTRMMKRLYLSLRENDRRRYAAIEATRLGHGGIETIARLLRCDPKTVRQGIADLEAEELEVLRPTEGGVDPTAIHLACPGDRLGFLPFDRAGEEDGQVGLVILILVKSQVGRKRLNTGENRMVLRFLGDVQLHRRVVEMVPHLRAEDLLGEATPVLEGVAGGAEANDGSPSRPLKPNMISHS
jgi:hypothetical protein